MHTLMRGAVNIQNLINYLLNDKFNKEYLHSIISSDAFTMFCPSPFLQTSGHPSACYFLRIFHFLRGWGTSSGQDIKRKSDTWGRQKRITIKLVDEQGIQKQWREESAQSKGRHWIAR